MIFHDLPPTHRYALCLFLPDPPRGPVPACFLIASARTASSLASSLSAVRELALTRDLAWSIPEPDIVTRHDFSAADATFAVLPLAEARARVTAHLIANELDFKDWMTRNSGRGRPS